jgi:hypothetical protein
MIQNTIEELCYRKIFEDTGWLLSDLSARIGLIGLCTKEQLDYDDNTGCIVFRWMRKRMLKVGAP